MIEAQKVAGLPMTEVILDIGPVAHGGHFVARLAAELEGETGSGKSGSRVVFVRHALPGEKVRAVLTEAEADAAFWRADAVEVLEGSVEFPDARVPHFWPEADSLRAHAAGGLPVGGAEFGHLRLPVQRALKAAVLAEQLQRLAGLDRVSEVEPVPGEHPEGLGWRTRAGFAVTGDGALGMHAHRSHEVLAVHDMPLAAAPIRALPWWEADFSGLERIEVAAPTSGDGPLILMAGQMQAAKRVVKELPGGVSAVHWDPKSSRISALRGRPWLRETVGAQEFRVSGDGFWQIHRKAPEVLSQAVGEYVSGFLSAGSAAADLYAGAGLFTALLAEAVGPTGAVFSVEGSPVTSKDAMHNFDGRAEVLVRPGRVERVLAAAARENRRNRENRENAAKLDAVVLDPPRTGAGKNVVQQICASGARAAVYVSCDPASFARDVGYFAAQGWQLRQLRAFDLYPHTHHLETVALLQPKG